MKEVKHNGQKYYLPANGIEMTIGRYIRLSKAGNEVQLLASLLDCPEDIVGEMPTERAEMLLATTGAWLPKFIEDCKPYIPADATFMGVKVEPMLSMTFGERIFMRDALCNAQADVVLVDVLCCAVGRKLYGKDWMECLDALRFEVRNGNALDGLRAFFLHANVPSNTSYYLAVWWSGLKERTRELLKFRK
jgi:hypothetical protein